jgi:hypothetical protein
MALRRSKGSGRMLARQVFRLAMVAMLLATVSQEVRSDVVAEAGTWRAFKLDKSCSIGIGNTNGFALLYFADNDAYALDMVSQVPWRFPVGIDPAVIVRIDGRLVLVRPDGAQRGNLIQFVLSGDEASTLSARIAEGRRMELSFPYSLNEGGYISLYGSREVVSAFSRCVAEARLPHAETNDSAQAAPDPTFPIGFEAFRKTLDEKIREDTLDKTQPDLNTTDICRRALENYICSFHEAGFQSAIDNFKKLDLANGRFTLKLRLRVATVDGQISQITLDGDRGDPANIIQFIGAVMAIIEVFDPGASQSLGGLKQIVDELGLMLGDNDPSIGRARHTIKPHAAISCIKQDSHETTGVECRFVPRS